MRVLKPPMQMASFVLPRGGPQWLSPSPAHPSLTSALALCASPKEGRGGKGEGGGDGESEGIRKEVGKRDRDKGRGKTQR